MHFQLFLAAILTAVTVAVHGGCTAVVIQFCSGMRTDHWSMHSLSTKVSVISALVVLMLAASLLEAWLWSLAYLWVGAIEGSEQALYFSVVTFTTLGYGDVTLDEGWRVLGSLQAAAGIVVFGWTTALVFTAVQRMTALGGERRRG